MHIDCEVAPDNRANTASQIKTMATSYNTTTSSRITPFTIYKANPRAGLRLFCFPYAGGSAALYRTWPAELPDTIEVCMAELPGRGSRLNEPPFTRLESIVDFLANAIKPYLDKPFAFFGHSMGAMISFELACRLREKVVAKPAHLFVSGRRAPQMPDTNPFTYNLPTSKLLEELRRLNGTPIEVLENPELMHLMLPLLRADFEVVETYVYSPGPALDCPITAFGGLQDQEVSREEVEAWREQTIASFSLRMLPGGHFFLHTARQLLLQMLSKELSNLTRAMN